MLSVPLDASELFDGLAQIAFPKGNEQLVRALIAGVGELYRSLAPNPPDSARDDRHSES